MEKTVRALVITLPNCPRISVGNLPTQQLGDQYFFSEDDFYNARTDVACRALRLMASEAMRTVGIKLLVVRGPASENELALFAKMRGVRDTERLVHIVVEHYYREALHYSEVSKFEAEFKAMLFPDLDDAMYDNLYDDMRAMMMNDLVDLNLQEKRDEVRKQVAKVVQLSTDKQYITDVAAASIHHQFEQQFVDTLKAMHKMRGEQLYVYIVAVVETVWSLFVIDSYRVAWPDFGKVDLTDMGEWFDFEDSYVWLRMICHQYDVAKGMYVASASGALFVNPCDAMKPIIFTERQIREFILGPVLWDKQFYGRYCTDTIHCTLVAAMKGLDLEYVLHLVDHIYGCSDALLAICIPDICVLRRGSFWDGRYNPDIWTRRLEQYLKFQSKVSGTLVLRACEIDGWFYIKQGVVYFEGKVVCDRRVHFRDVDDRRSLQSH